ncbi:sensor histidine kinase [Novispirillum sp. DQ9]|uniref:sensor histidine kinase n=1 Tax=Novispirillum sp. DQ9 TaxID=3398612 RepID=UPI003C7E2EE1
MTPAVTLVVSAAIGVVIGMFVSVIGVGTPLSANIALSASAGVFICAAAEIAHHLGRRWSAPRRVAAFAVAIVAGTVPSVGVALAVIAPTSPAQTGAVVLKVVVACLLFGSILTTVFVLNRRRTSLARDLREAGRAELEARLRMLQAQIEPHFLFNTLATLSDLVDTDAAQARALLDRLVVYLRATLSQSRADRGGTLGDELALVRAYLEICAMRIGPRMSWRIDCPAPLEDRAFPLMLLQPLVENAVRHGVEPKPGPVSITVAVRLDGGHLRIAVSDTGLGVGASMPGGGFGLENVRSRLRALHGAAGGLRLAAGPDGGAVATLDIPA